MKSKKAFVIIFMMTLATALYSTQGNEKVDVVEVYRNDFVPLKVINPHLITNRKNYMEG